MRSRELSPLQLEIVMHLANGKYLTEIAVLKDMSLSHVKKQANLARRRKEARTLPQLVSIVIASDQLEWVDGNRRINGANPPA